MEMQNRRVVAIDTGQFRKALGRFATGVTVVTAVSPEGTMIGLTVNSFNSVSMDPPLILWSVGRNSRRGQDLMRAKGFAVNVLAGNQLDIANRFSRWLETPFDGVDYRLTANGLPVLDRAVAHFECEHHAQHDGGDHVILIGRVLDYSLGDGSALVYAGGRFTALDVHSRPNVPD
ncbi:flavin reductase family protein [Rhizobium lusitanum]|uniref:flavin reductase family protein n=1 Tax=Rhizobium lusitanum TaxID=293958 RepID=UPI00195B73B6|nr:flavin reductase family protein [Rhizobium lusitanum]MBM7049231.1 flavin reductase family protein [Rhizobium lusitanum]